MSTALDRYIFVLSKEIIGQYDDLQVFGYVHGITMVGRPEKKIRDDSPIFYEKLIKNNETAGRGNPVPSSSTICSWDYNKGRII